MKKVLEHLLHVGAIDEADERLAETCRAMTAQQKRCFGIELDHHATRIQVDQTDRRLLEHGGVAIECGFEAGHSIEPLLGLFAPLGPEDGWRGLGRGVRPL